jgi:hypothetical protein
MHSMPRLRSAVASPAAFFALVSIAIALLTLWTVAIPKVGAIPSFGFQSPICWLVVLALLGALLLPNLRVKTASLLAAELLLIAWYAWSIWLVTTPTYSSQYTFVGTDIVGAAWYAAGLGVLCAAAVVALRYHDGDDPPGPETLWLAAVPGFGLVRLGKTSRGLVWTTLVVAALFVATFDSPIAPLFQPLNGLPELPDPVPTRAPTWILIGAAALFALLSVADTIRMKRRLAQR